MHSLAGGLKGTWSTAIGHTDSQRINVLRDRWDVLGGDCPGDWTLEEGSAAGGHQVAALYHLWAGLI